MKKALFIFLLLFPAAVYASATDVRITEIMYDALGNDTDREWVELWNGGSETVTIVGGNGVGSWRFNNGTNRLFASDIVRGSYVLAPGDFLIISSKPETFLADYPNFSGNLTKSSFVSLNNTGGTLFLRIETHGTPWSETAYSEGQGGGDNDGKTLEWNRETGAWRESADMGGSPGSFGTSGAALTPPPAETPAPEPDAPTASEQTAEAEPSPPPDSPATAPPTAPALVPDAAINNEAEPEDLPAVMDIPTAAAASEATVKSNESTSSSASPLASLASIRELKLNARVRVRGTVVATPTISTGQIFYIVDEQAGLQIYSSKKDFPPLSIGDIIEVSGTVGEANKERRVRISASDAIRVVGRGAVPPAADATITELKDELVGRLVRLSGTVVARTSTGFTIEDESGELTISPSEGSGVAAPQEGDGVTIVGVLGKGRQSYRLMPRGPEDITNLSPAKAAPSQSPVKSAHPVAASILMGGAAVALGLWGRKDLALRALGAMRVFIKKK